MEGGRRFALTAVIIIALAVTGGAIAADKPTIKDLMGENFAGLQAILVGLITSNYANVPAQSAVIREHAVQLTGVIPDAAKDDPDQFLAYAYLLRSNADSLESISRLLIEHDQAQASQGRLAVDHLREALAAHYGGVVTACVACHNRYRPQIVQ